MAFNKSNVTASTAKADPGLPGGRYAGIRPRPPSAEKLRAGEYILVGVKSELSRKKGTAMCYAKVEQSTGGGDFNNVFRPATTPGEDPRLFMINFAGKSYDSGIERLLQLTMTVANCATIEQLAKDEPHYDELLDLLAHTREHSEHYPDNPLAGVRFWARGRNSTTIADDGEPFVNWEFGITE